MQCGCDQRRRHKLYSLNNRQEVQLNCLGLDISIGHHGKCIFCVIQPQKLFSFLSTEIFLAAAVQHKIWKTRLSSCIVLAAKIGNEQYLEESLGHRNIAYYKRNTVNYVYQKDGCKLIF